MHKGNRTFSLMLCQDSLNLSWLTLCRTFILPHFSIISLKFASLQFEALFTQFFIRSVIFPYNSLYTQAVAYTAYFELGETVDCSVLT